MKNKKQESRNLVEMKNFLDYNKKINKEDNTFQKLMVIYKMAIKELNTKVEIIKEEYKLFYNYDLIDHMNFRIKEPDSIIKKMKNKKRKLSDFVEYLKSRQFFGVCMCNYVLHRNEGEV